MDVGRATLMASLDRRANSDYAESNIFRTLGGTDGRVAEYLGEGV